jgi:hypothetical protein
MALLGIDVGRNLATPNSEILALGVNWVRAPITPDAPVQELHDRIEHLRHRRVKTALVIDSTAIGSMSFDEAAQFYRDSYASVVGAFECGNEADAGWNFGSPDNSAAGRRARRQQEGGPGFVEPSWIMDPQDLTALVNAFRAKVGEEFELWSGGLCCGQPEFLDSPGLNLSKATRVAIHPYGKEGAEATGLVNRYATKLENRPWGSRFLGADSIVVSEFGFPSAAGSLPSEQVQAQQIMGVTNTLVNQPRLGALILFCYDNNQDAGGFGLKAGSTAKAAFGLFQTLAMGVPGHSDVA